MPRLSIVIATWQCAAVLPRCLRSLQSQRFQDWELLVADGGSTDGTAELIRHAPHLAYWHSRPDRGIYDAWNEGIRRASGEYVCFLGADDAWHGEDALERVFERIGTQCYDLVTVRGRLRDRDGRLLHDFGLPWDYRRVQRRLGLCHPGTLHRRELFDAYGVFDDSFKITGDYDFLLRLPPALRTLHCDFPVVDVEDGGISRARWWTMLRERYRAQARCPRIGPLRARLQMADKLWRMPIARLLGLPH